MNKTSIDDYRILSKAKSFKQGVTQLGVHKWQETIEEKIESVLLEKIHAEGLDYEDVTNLKALKLINHLANRKKDKKQVTITENQHGMLTELKERMQSNPDLNQKITDYFMQTNEALPYFNERIDFFTKPVATEEKYQRTTEKFRIHIDNLLKNVPVKSILPVDETTTFLEIDTLLTELGRAKYGKNYREHPEYMLQSIDGKYGLRKVVDKECFITYTSKVDQRQRMISREQRYIIDNVFDFEKNTAVPFSAIKQQFIMHYNLHDSLISLIRPLYKPQELLLAKGVQIINSVNGIAMQPKSLHKAGDYVYCLGYPKGQPDNMQLYCAEGIFTHYIDPREKRQPVRKVISVNDRLKTVTLLHRNGQKFSRQLSDLRYD